MFMVQSCLGRERIRQNSSLGGVSKYRYFIKLMVRQYLIRSIIFTCDQNLCAGHKEICQWSWSRRHQERGTRKATHCQGTWWHFSWKRGLKNWTLFWRSLLPLHCRTVCLRCDVVTLNNCALCRHRRRRNARRRRSRRRASERRNTATRKTHKPNHLSPSEVGMAAWYTLSLPVHAVAR